METPKHYKAIPRQLRPEDSPIPESPIWKRRAASRENLSRGQVTGQMPVPGARSQRPEVSHGVAVDDDGEKASNTRCGFLCWQPDWLQRCADMKLFVPLMALLYLCSSTFYAYRLGVVTTMERRFRLSSSQSGLTMSSFEISHLSSVLLLSFFCKAAHRPRLVAMGGLLTSIAAVLFILPHFLYGSGIADTSSVSVEVVSNTSGIGSLSTGQSLLCVLDNSTVPGSSGCTGDGGNTEASGGGGTYPGAFGLFLASSLVLGVAFVPMNTLGLAYIDDNVDKQKAPLYLGIVMAMNQGSSITGFLLAALFTSMFVDLYDPGFGPNHPMWLGAWWLGAAVLAAFIILPSLIMTCFPHEMPDKPIPEKDPEEEEKEAQSSDINILSGLRRLLTNPVFLLLSIAACLDCHLFAGFLTFLPKFLEVQFNLSASLANILAALLSGVTGMMGSFIGGAISSRLRTMTQTCIFLIVNSVVSTAGLVVLGLLSCGDVTMAGPKQLGPGSLTCDGCTCGLETSAPVCGSDGVNYITPCWAGCSDMASASNITGCGCDSTGWASPGLCPTSCNMLIPYAAILVTVMLIGSLNPTPALALTLRYVDVDLKSLALGIFNSGLSLLTYIPGPTVFGLVVDGACLVWQEVCGAAGACLWYDLPRYRLIIHGLTAALRACAAAFYIGLWILLRSRQRKELSQRHLEESMPMTSSLRNKDAKNHDLTGR